MNAFDNHHTSSLASTLSPSILVQLVTAPHQLCLELALNQVGTRTISLTAMDSWAQYPDSGR